MARPKKVRQLAVDPAKQRFLRHHWHQYLHAVTDRRVKQFFQFIVSRYFLTFGYGDVRTAWDGVRREEDLTNEEQLRDRGRLVAHVSWFIQNWYRQSDGIWMP
ncbi:hypothetical protein R3P38DRAFT_3173001 [Favolaschia claudopus]|uniref:Uncharacterized protein n=1 Tax=Favolaschia claudopus TaxID=2862362 RepID=A0AAW0DPE9_9AGAR